MKKVVILGNRSKEAVLRAVEKLEPWLSRQAEVSVDLEMESEIRAGDADFAVSLGGDGTVLGAARQVAPQGIPLLGINVGNFGFLTETTVEDAQSVLADVLAGSFTLADRMMIRCVLERDGHVHLDTVGLNDAVLSRTSLSRLITIDLQVNGEPVTTYRADGIIVATPVGSTAHSLASGGPIVFPDMQALVITPICPHTLSNRPLVLPASMTIEMASRDVPEPPALTVDGQVHSVLHEGDLVQVRRAEAPLRLIKADRHTFFETLRNKLDWRGQPRYVR